MLTEVLPSEILSLVLAQLCLVRNIKRVKRVCRAIRNAAGPAEQIHRRTCYEYTAGATCVATAPDGQIIISWDDNSVTITIAVY